MDGLHDKIARFQRFLIDFRYQNVPNPVNIKFVQELKPDASKMAFLVKEAWAIAPLCFVFIAERTQWNLKRILITKLSSR